MFKECLKIDLKCVDMQFYGFLQKLITDLTVLADAELTRYNIWLWMSVVLKMRTR